jgi:hypothetical protein
MQTLHKLVKMKKALLIFWLITLSLSLLAQSNIIIKLSSPPREIKVSPAKLDSFGSVTIIKSDTSKNYLYRKKSFRINCGCGNNSNPPLYIIDGVISDQGASGLDANDIKSINVQKSIKAIEIYGEKGKNGVIIITTKKNSI